MASRANIRVGLKRQDSNFALTLGSQSSSRFLTPFQVEKFTYMFNALFDLEKNGLLEKDDIDALVEKMRTYCGWDKDNEMYQNIVDVHHCFYECICDQVLAEKSASDYESGVVGSWADARKPEKIDVNSITLAQWLNMWGRLCRGSSGLHDFPIWVQLLPKIFFQVIDVEKDGILSLAEYRRFYKDFVGLPEKDLDKVTAEGYRSMTAGGDYKFDLDHFNFVFINFLLGRSIYGPGKYIFGCFDNTDMEKPYKVLYNQEDEE